MVKPPLSVRQNPECLEQFHAFKEAVPQGLRASIGAWLDGHYGQTGLAGYRATRYDRVSRLERFLNVSLPRGHQEFMECLLSNDALLLDAVDHALGADCDRTQARHLMTMLDEARSMYMVGMDDEGRLELQLRQPVELTELVEAAANSSTRAAAHLRTAWSQAFARAPDPTSACLEVVKAIEVVAKPVVTPTDARATLGKMIRAMQDKPSKWTTQADGSGDVEAVIGLMELVWIGCPRHGDDSQPVGATIECAQMLVQTGALLVHWFQAGRIRAL